MATKKPVITKAASKRELSTNNYIGAIIAVTLIIVIICGLIGKSMVGSLVINTKLISGKLQAKNDLNTKLANIPVLLNNYQNLGNAKKLIADGLPNNPDFPQIISIMNSISTASGVTLKQVAPPTDDGSTDATATTATPAASAATGAASSSTSPTPYLFTATISGPYTQLVNFFQNLERSDRPMHVTGAQFTGDSGIVSVDLTIQTYYQSEASINDTTEPVK